LIIRPFKSMSFMFLNQLEPMRGKIAVVPIGSRTVAIIHEETLRNSDRLFRLRFNRVTLIEMRYGKEFFFLHLRWSRSW
jgi:hypothetical protein